MSNENPRKDEIKSFMKIIKNKLKKKIYVLNQLADTGLTPSDLIHAKIDDGEGVLLSVVAVYTEDDHIFLTVPNLNDMGTMDGHPANIFLQYHQDTGLIEIFNRT